MKKGKRREAGAMGFVSMNRLDFVLCLCFREHFLTFFLVIFYIILRIGQVHNMNLPAHVYLSVHRLFDCAVVLGVCLNHVPHTRLQLLLLYFCYC